MSRNKTSVNKGCRNMKTEKKTEFDDGDAEYMPSLFTRLQTKYISKEPINKGLTRASKGDTPSSNAAEKSPSLSLSLPPRIRGSPDARKRSIPRSILKSPTYVPTSPISNRSRTASPTPQLSPTPPITSRRWPWIFNSKMPWKPTAVKFEAEKPVVGATEESYEVESIWDHAWDRDRAKHSYLIKYVGYRWPEWDVWVECCAAKVVDYYEECWLLEKSREDEPTYEQIVSEFEAASDTVKANASGIEKRLEKKKRKSLSKKRGVKRA